VGTEQNIPVLDLTARTVQWLTEPRAVWLAQAADYATSCAGVAVSATRH
jgi:hypothetical protein